jgi:hypothetical protein
MSKRSEVARFAPCDNCGEIAGMDTSDCALAQIARCVAAIERRMIDLEAALHSSPVEPARKSLVKTDELARMFGLHRNWIYQHKEDLGAIAIGDGPRPRLLFDPEVARQRLASCSLGSRTPGLENGSGKPKRRNARKASTGTNGHLLPIKGPERP